MIRLFKKRERPEERLRRPWWQRVLRAGVIVFLLLAIIYATMPLWLPTTWIGETFCDYLSDKLNAPVSIDSVSVGWIDGVVIKGVRLGDPQNPSQPILTIRSIECDFSPIRILTTEQCDYMNIDSLELMLRRPVGGRWNIESLLEDEETPSSEFTPLQQLQHMLDEFQGGPDRISLRESTLILEDGEAAPLRFPIQDLQIVQSEDEKLGLITMSAALDQDNNTAPISLRLAGPMKPGDPAATLLLYFAGLDLSQLPLPNDGPIRSMSGFCRGKLAFCLTENLHIDEFRLELAASQLGIHPKGAAPLPVVEEAGLKFNAGMDALTQKIDVRSMQLKLPGLSLRGNAELFANVLAGELDGLEQAHLTGEVRPGTLAALLTGRPDFDGQWRVVGPMSFSVQAIHDNQALNLDIQADGGKVAVYRFDQMLKPAGQTCKIDLHQRLFEHTGRLNIADAQLQWGENVLRMNGVIGDIYAAAKSIQNAQPLQAAKRVNLSGTVDLTDWNALLPASAVKPKGQISGLWALHAGSDGNTQMSMDLQAPTAKPFQIGPFLSKPAGQPLGLECVLGISQKSNRFSDIAVRLIAGACNGNLRLESSPVNPSDKTYTGRWGLNYVEGLAKMLHLTDASGVELAGHLGGKLEFTFKPKSPESPLWATTFTCNAHEVEARYQDWLTKSAAQPLAGQGQLWGWKNRVKLTASGNGVNLTFAARRHRRDKWGVAAEADIDFSKWPKGLSPRLDRVINEFKPAGVLNGAFRGTVDRREVHLQARFNANNMSIGPWRGIQKPLATPATTRIELTLPLDPSQKVVVQWNAALDNATFSGKGTFQANLADADPKWGHWAGQARLLIPDAKILNNIIQAGDFSKAAGQLDIHTRFAGNGPAGNVSLSLSANKLACTLFKETCQLDGLLIIDDLAWAPDKLLRLKRCRAEALKLGVGKNVGWCFADASWRPGCPKGDIRILLDYLDTEAMEAWAQNFSPADSSEIPTVASLPAPVISTPTSMPASAPARKPSLTAAEKNQLEKKARNILSRLQRETQNADLTVKLNARKLITPDTASPAFFDLDQLAVAIRLLKSQAQVRYFSGLSGGTISGVMSTQFTGDKPVLYDESHLREVVSTERIQPAIASYFPGNTVEGLFTRDEQVQYSLLAEIANTLDSRYPVYPVGQSKMIATNGYVLGRAAPYFVTQIFPGLNLARYNYHRMTGFTKNLPNGTAENEMIFSGAYDMYMQGETNKDNKAHYTMGLQLLGSLSSPEWKHDWKQGRMPILIIKGTIQDCKMMDESVSYPWPNESLGEIFIRNNLIYRAWLNSNKKTESPASQPAEL